MVIALRKFNGFRETNTGEETHRIDPPVNLVLWKDLVCLLIFLLAYTANIY